MLVHFFQALIVISILFGSTADLVGQQKEIWEPKNIGQYKSTFNYKGIFQQYRILCRTFGDLDKDGHQEVIIGYGPRDEEIQPWGGVLILEESSHRKNYKKVFHALFEHIFPKKISATGSNLNITMVKVTDEGEKIS